MRKSSTLADNLFRQIMELRVGFTPSMNEVMKYSPRSYLVKAMIYCLC